MLHLKPYKVCKEQRDSMRFLRKIVRPKECISYKGLTKYFSNPLFIGISEGELTEWE